MTRADRNNNPTAFTTDIAKEAGLVLGTDYEEGDPFLYNAVIYHTAKLLGDPIELTIRVLNSIGFYTSAGEARWDYIAIPHIIWHSLLHKMKVNTIGFMYEHEGGETMRHLFPNYGAK